MIAAESDIVSMVLQHKAIETYFHPIVSLRKNHVLGFEALSRGVDPASGSMIPPDVLFSSTESDIIISMDRLCRQKAIENFAKLPFDNRNYFLALNFDSTLVDRGVVGSGKLVNTILNYGIKPEQVVIEILESKVKDIQALKEFVKLYKEYGFLIALDDVGAGHSNLDRLVYLQADIVKIDRDLIKNIHREYYKQEVVKALIALSHKVGAIVVAEGVETEEEVIASIEYGADLLQGFYFGKPSPLSCSIMEGLATKIHKMSSMVRTHKIQSITENEKRKKQYNKLIKSCIEQISQTADNAVDDVLRNLVARNASLECLYVLNEFGVQISDTICNRAIMQNKNNLLFQPAPKGADQSGKDYYILINSGLHVFVTEPYISLASGNLCITISKAFTNHEGNRFILCMDIYPEKNESNPTRHLQS